jgi:predicted lipoprotein with Yx(FWY)xxD motif
MLLIAGLSLTACSSNDKSRSDDTPVPVSTRVTGLGDIFTTDAGMTLYTFNNDTPGQSNCNGPCAVNWPPLAAADDAVDQGRFSVVTRNDSSRQWALDGWPLYTWINDNVPGDTTGEAVNQLWYVAMTVPVSQWHTQVTTAGVDNMETVLTDAERMSMYVFTKDVQTPDGSACNGNCADAWPPLLADSEATVSGHFTLVTRDDGARQWAFRGMPLYRWASDTAPGDTTGEHVNSVWYVAQPVPVSKHNTDDHGVVLTDTQWMTLYTLDTETTENPICAGGCLANWPPLLAGDGDIARGNYDIFVNAEGDRQWAYKNHPLYTWVNDNASGETTGHGVAHPSGLTWQVVTP